MTAHEIAPEVAPRSAVPALALIDERWATQQHLELTCSLESAPARDWAARLLSPSTSKPARDRILLSLIEQSQLGSQLAFETVLQFLRPTLLGQAKIVARGNQVTYSDGLSICIATAWEICRTYRVRTRRSSVAMNLRCGIMRRMSDDFVNRMQGLEDLTDPDEFASFNEPAERPTPRAEAEVITLLTWARDNEVLTSNEIRQVAVWKLGTARDQLELTEELAISRQTLNKRVQRFLARLRDAVALHLREYGSLVG